MNYSIFDNYFIYKGNILFYKILDLDNQMIYIGNIKFYKQPSMVSRWMDKK